MFSHKKSMKRRNNAKMHFERGKQKNKKTNKKKQ